jgi:uncharacterized protein (TIGR02757 family)
MTDLQSSGRRLRQQWSQSKDNHVSGLAEALEALYTGADLTVIAPDPLELILEYSEPDDREVAGLLASSWAYGRADLIVKNAGEGLGLMGKSPADFVDALPSAAKDSLDVFRNLKYRFHRGGDWATLCWFAADLRKQYGSMGAAIRDYWHISNGDLQQTLSSFHEVFREGRYLDRLKDTGVRLDYGDQKHLLPDASQGSACKRLNLWLRWMVRQDKVDPGSWCDLAPGGPQPSDLVIPLDTHIARLGRYLGLTDYLTPGWKMASEITDSLARFDPLDPVKYDFALCRLGILDLCPKKRDKTLCEQCPILHFCRL